MKIIALQSIFVLITYFIAAIPFGLLLTKVFCKKDVRQFGSGNIGATNVMRVAGKKIALLTLLLDAFKGGLMVMAARFYFSHLNNLHIFLLIIGFVAIIAHIYPIYLGFKGGKGVATTLAVILAIDFSAGFLAICFWLLSFCFFRISAISSIIAVLSTIISSIYYHSSNYQIAFCFAISLVVIWRHKENIARILTGKENGFK